MNSLKIVLVSITVLSGCSTTSGNAPKSSEVKVDFVAGYSGEDRIIVSDDNAMVHSDRNAVREYTSTVDTINLARQAVEGDLVGLALCRKYKAEQKDIVVKEGPMSVPCMKKVVLDHDRAGNDLVQVNGKLVLRKKDDFKSRIEEARACLDTFTEIRDQSREAYMLEGCRKVLADVNH